MSSIVGVEDGLTEAPVASSSYGIVAAKDDVQADRDDAIDCGKASRDRIAFQSSIDSRLVSDTRKRVKSLLTGR